MVKKRSKNNSENKSDGNKIRQTSDKIYFVYTITSVLKGAMSSEVTQIIDNEMKKRLRKVVLMDCLTF